MSLIAVVLVAGSINVARAADEPNNVFRFGAAWVVPDGETSLGGSNSLDAQDEIGYFLDYERRLIPWLGLDFQVLYATPTFAVRDDTTGATIPGTETSVEVWTGSAGVNFHFFGRSRFDLYLGAFGGYTDFKTDDPNDELDGTYSYGGVLGFDIGLTKNGLVLTTSVRYSVTDADATQFPGLTVPYDPLVYQLGLGWRF
jgi:outer membrane protein W